MYINAKSMFLRVFARFGRGNLLEADLRVKKWCTRRDSNSRPIAPEAIALSS